MTTTPEDREARGPVAQRLCDTLDEAASRLWDTPDRPQDDIPEDVLAREIVTAIPAGERDAALWYLCHEQAALAASPSFLLDECADSTYEAISRIAAVLHETITAQAREDYTMMMIASEEIRCRYELERGMRELRDAGVAI